MCNTHTHTITGCSGCALERLSCFATEGSSDTVTSRLISHYQHQARESNANMALPHTRCYVRVRAGPKGDQTTGTAECAMTLNVWLRQESTQVNQIKFELGKEMEFNDWYRWSCRWQSKHLRLVYWRHKESGNQHDEDNCERNITVLKDTFESSYMFLQHYRYIHCVYLMLFYILI